MPDDWYKKCLPYHDRCSTVTVECIKVLLKAANSYSPASSDVSPTTVPTQSSFDVAMVDAMAELQSLDKSKTIQTFSVLFHNFASKIDMKYRRYHEIHLVFDTYCE